MTAATLAGVISGTRAFKAEVDADLWALTELVSSWAWHLEPVFPHPWPYTFHVTVKTPETAVSALTPREVRAALLSSAEDMLDALAGAGWQLTEYPLFSFTGNVDRFRTDALSGKLLQPSEQYGIGLEVTFVVDRPRVLGERAAH